MWLLENKTKIDNGDMSKQLIADYNQIVDLAKTYPTIFKDENIKNLFEKFPRIDETEIHKVPDNSDLYCEQLNINDADIFSLKCSWKGESVKVNSAQAEGGRRRKSFKKRGRRKSIKKMKSKSTRRKASHSHKKRRH